MMTNIKDLEKFLKLCRKQGVESIKFDGVEVYLGPLPQAAKPQKSYAAASEAINRAFDPGQIVITPLPEAIETEELTEEQKMFYSVAPENSQQN